MGFNWLLYFELAKDILNQQRNMQIQQEEYLRTIISRFYYSIFCIARNHLLKKGLIVPPKNSHKFVRDNYINSPDIIEHEIGNSLSRLWERRKNADYDDDKVIKLEDTTFAYQLTIKVIDKLRKINAIT